MINDSILKHNTAAKNTSVAQSLFCFLQRKTLDCGEKGCKGSLQKKVVRDIAQSREKCLGGGPIEASRQRAVLSLPDGDTSVFVTFFGLSGPKKCTTQEAFVAWLAC